MPSLYILTSIQAIQTEQKHYQATDATTQTFKRSTPQLEKISYFWRLKSPHKIYETNSQKNNSEKNLLHGMY